VAGSVNARRLEIARLRDLIRQSTDLHNMTKQELTGLGGEAEELATAPPAQLVARRRTNGDHPVLHPCCMEQAVLSVTACNYTDWADWAESIKLAHQPHPNKSGK
jgi:hypothetical protein